MKAGYVVAGVFTLLHVIFEFPHGLRAKRKADLTFGRAPPPPFFMGQILPNRFGIHHKTRTSYDIERRLGSID